MCAGLSSKLRYPPTATDSDWETKRMVATVVYRKLLIVVAVGLVFMAGYVYATTHLNIGGTGAITLPNTNLFADVTSITTSTVCSALPTTSYADTGLSVAWPGIVQGTSSSIYICLRNTGSGIDTLSFTPGTLPAGVTFTSPQQGSALGASGFVLSQLIFTATTTAMAGSFSFTLAIT